MILNYQALGLDYSFGVKEFSFKSKFIQIYSEFLWEKLSDINVFLKLKWLWYFSFGPLYAVFE